MSIGDLAISAYWTALAVAGLLAFALGLAVVRGVM